jgi:hypothetical protein
MIQHSLFPWHIVKGCLDYWITHGKNMDCEVMKICLDCGTSQAKNILLITNIFMDY